MKLALLLASGLVVLPSLVAAHGDHIPGVPRIFGRRGINNVEDLKARAPRDEALEVVRRHQQMAAAEALEERASSTVDEELTPHQIEERQAANTAGQCGPGVGSCAAGYCCSGAVSKIPYHLVQCDRQYA